MTLPASWRASWKGFLSLGALNCGVALYAAASTSERISLHLVNRRTGGRLRRKYVDEETGQTVEADDQVKGYEIAKGEYVPIEGDEIEAILSRSGGAAKDKTIQVDCFLGCDDIDSAFLDRPYFIAPTDKPSAGVLSLLAEGMAESKVAALGEALLFRRMRRLLIRPATEGGALLASTLRFDYEVRPTKGAMADMPNPRVSKEMLDLAVHIIRSKRGAFDPAAFEDRYETALAALVRAKSEGKPPPKLAPRRAEKKLDLIAALRSSAAALDRRQSAKPPAKARRRAAGAKRNRRAG
jgi:DNA end-binding protein Ku